MLESLAWDILWHYNLIAGIVSFFIAHVSIRLYSRFSGSKPDERAANSLLAIIFSGVALSIVSRMILDYEQAYSSQFNLSVLHMVTRIDFWGSLITNLMYLGNIQVYGVNILLAVAFAAWGCQSIVRRLYKTTRLQQHAN